MAQAQTETKDMAAKEEEERLISTLPRRKGYCWEWLPASVIHSFTTVQAQFQPRNGDIILATHPKCGTTWLKALAFTVVHRSRYDPITDYGHHPLLSHGPHDLVPYLELGRQHLHFEPKLEELPSPRLLGTHLPLALLPSGMFASGSRVVYLCREPKDVLVSLWHHFKVIPELREFDQAFELVCDGVSMYGPIWEHYLGYWKQSKIEPKSILFFKYEEMIVEPTKHVKLLAEFLGVPFTNEEESRGVVEEVVKLCSFQHLKSLPVNVQGVSEQLGRDNSMFFRKAKVGDWANYFTQEMS